MSADDAARKSPTRLSINISDDTRADLLTLADRHGTSVTDIVRRAVTVYRLVESETRSGRRLLIVATDGTEREVVLL